MKETVLRQLRSIANGKDADVFSWRTDALAKRGLIQRDGYLRGFHWTPTESGWLVLKLKGKQWH